MEDQAGLGAGRPASRRTSSAGGPPAMPSDISVSKSDKLNQDGTLVRPPSLSIHFIRPYHTNGAPGLNQPGMIGIASPQNGIGRVVSG